MPHLNTYGRNRAVGHSFGRGVLVAHHASRARSRCARVPDFVILDSLHWDLMMLRGAVADELRTLLHEWTVQGAAQAKSARSLARWEPWLGRVAAEYERLATAYINAVRARFRSKEQPLPLIFWSTMHQSLPVHEHVAGTQLRGGFTRCSVCASRAEQRQRQEGARTPGAGAAGPLREAGFGEHRVWANASTVAECCLGFVEHVVSRLNSAAKSVAQKLDVLVIDREHLLREVAPVEYLKDAYHVHEDYSAAFLNLAFNVLADTPRFQPDTERVRAAITEPAAALLPSLYTPGLATSGAHEHRA